jgi:murein DD-endopeptidase MepM/ murein hydrolase activator NlpD
MRKRILIRNISIIVIGLVVAFLTMRSNLHIRNEQTQETAQQPCKEICGTVKKGETLFDIFKKYRLHVEELFALKEASADVHRLGDLYPGRAYKITVNDDNRINSFTYCIDEENILRITRTDSGFSAEKKCVEYNKRIEYVAEVIKDNLISSIGEGSEKLRLALQLSDIYAWDIDFNTDLRNGDQFRIVVEGLYLNGEFKKYGDILSAEFINNGETYRAYRFECKGVADYFDADGKSLKRAFLKAPVSFRRISSGFTNRRFHPILKLYRPHHGLDYAAPLGSPVSAVGEGAVAFSGYRGEYGKLIILRHPNGWNTYYGHLSRIARSIKRGKRVHQGDIIGYVGATGLATGPHLHFEMRIQNRPVNPLKVRLPRGKRVPDAVFAEFRRFRDRMDKRIASISGPSFALAGRDGDGKI